MRVARRLNCRRVFEIRSRLFGGSSSVNGMVADRGNPATATVGLRRASPSGLLHKPLRPARVRFGEPNCLLMPLLPVGKGFHGRSRPGAETLLHPLEPLVDHACVAKADLSQPLQQELRLFQVCRAKAFRKPSVRRCENVGCFLALALAFIKPGEIGCGPKLE